MKQKWDAIRQIINKQKRKPQYCPVESKLLGKHYSTIADRLNSKLKKH